MGTKRVASGTSDSNEKHDPLPVFLVTDLSRLAFRVGENTYQADDTEHIPDWTQFISEHANVPSGIDWSDLEERAHFLNRLFAHCSSRNIPFPLVEKLNGKLNER